MTLIDHKISELKSSIHKEMKAVSCCSRCILDSNDDPAITFNEQGLCNYCTFYDARIRSQLTVSERSKQLKELVEEVASVGKGNKYDCVIGLSGGIDSTYVAWLIKDLGLRPLAVHLDYGWNSETAVENIESTVRILGIDLHTHVVNWEEVKDLQLSFLKASVVDIELINDFAIFSTLQNEAYKRGIKFIFLGMNIATEGVIMPKDWTHEKLDQLNIRAIHKKFGKVNLKTYPKLSFLKRIYLKKIFKLQLHDILNYLDYNKEEAEKVVIEKLGWKRIEGKHFESIFTRFYQAYILPYKFNIDKRKFHYSVLIYSGQLTKQEAVEKMKQPVYDPQMFADDYAFVLKKLELSEGEFESLMQLEIKKHLEYDSYLTKHYKYHERFFRAIGPIYQFIKKFRD